MKKRLLAILFVLTMIPLVLTGCDSSSEKANPATDFEYEGDSNNGVVITKYIGTDTEVDIPEKIEGSTVTQIGKEAFANNTSIVSVKMPDTITTIKDYAFNGCSSLTTVILSQTLDYICSGSFSDCNNLSEIILPTSLQRIGNNIFENCTSLKHIKIPGSLQYIQMDTFRNSGLETVEIEEGVIQIGNYAFSGTKLKDVVLPESVTDVLRGAFYSCNVLESVTLNNGVKTLDVLAFGGKSKLTEIILPNSVTSVNEYTFAECDTLEKVMFEGNAPDNYTGKVEVPDSNYTIYYHSDAEGFTSPEWNGYKTEIW